MDSGKGERLSRRETTTDAGKLYPSPFAIPVEKLKYRTPEGDRIDVKRVMVKTAGE